jgi:hypothetical protein
MKNHLKTSTLILILFLFNSCSYFSNDKEEKRKAENLKWKQEKEIKANKDYLYINQSVSFETNIPKDTVAIVLREYYRTYIGFVFNKKRNSLEEIDSFPKIYFEDNNTHELDFINSIIKKQFVNEKSAYLIFNKIDYFFNNKNIKEELEYIEGEIDDLKPTD